MLKGGGAFMSIGLGEGPDKAKAAIEQALHHPLLEIDGLEQSSGVLVHFTGGEDLTLHEVGEAVTDLRDTLKPDAELILGATSEETMTGRAQAILIVTGIGGKPVYIPTEETLIEQPVAISQQAVDVDDLDLPTFLRRRVSKN
jgi:cell division protein FtsZ